MKSLNSLALGLWEVSIWWKRKAITIPTGTSNKNKCTHSRRFELVASPSVTWYDIPTKDYMKIDSFGPLVTSLLLGSCLALACILLKLILLKDTFPSLLTLWFSILISSVLFLVLMDKSGSSRMRSILFLTLTIPQLSSSTMSTTRRLKSLLSWNCAQGETCTSVSHTLNEVQPRLSHRFSRGWPTCIAVGTSTETLK